MEGLFPENHLTSFPTLLQGEIEGFEQKMREESSDSSERGPVDTENKHWQDFYRQYLWLVSSLTEQC